MIYIFETIAGTWMIGDVNLKRSVNSEPEFRPVAVKNPRLIKYRHTAITGAISAEFAHVDAVNKPEFIYTLMSTWFSPTADFIEQYKEHLDEKKLSRDL